ncbi:SGNH/GDSL hydrolase family protein [Gordonia rubripertincta]|uniref:SGNH/GDSL hydrolase family protein n=1 Tax=Gordonia rubripertincta TaxID=36822 RepID=UPI001180FA10|nr:SGNH/GDSL hydrolase family protein [Gordonia rubripertincta]TSD96220.1 SGNH/GDSL hydrolase family protein [Gordonia rubripertincta]
MTRTVAEWWRPAGRRMSSVVACAMLLCAVGAACESADDAALPVAPGTQPVNPIDVAPSSHGGLRILYLGDSITRGSGASSYADSYRERITATAKQAYPVTEQVVAQGGARLAEVAAVAAPVAAADIVVIQLGTNDLLAPPTPTDLFSRQYRDLMISVRQVNPTSAVICAGLWRPSSKARHYDRVIQDECSASRSRFVPLSDLFDNPELRGPVGREALGIDGHGDSFHPNNRGHSEIAKRLTGTIRLERAEASP